MAKAPPQLLFVCTTCPRDVPVVGATRGRQLAAALRAASEQTSITLREVACLNGCRNPCNVALRGFRRWTYRFSRCTLEDVEALLGVARRYWSASRGELTPADLPPQLQDKVTARTPPPADSSNSAVAEVATARRGETNGTDPVPQSQRLRGHEAEK